MSEGKLVKRDFNIIVNTRFSALHCWPGCNIPGKEYLKNPHRHEFHVQVKIRVNHTDRDVEFIDFKEKLNCLLGCDFEGKNLETMSCEMICEIIRNEFHKYPIVYVRVLEDGENGSEMVISPF